MKRLIAITTSTTFLLGVISIEPAHTHGGGLNQDGCHNNRNTGDYHCHRSGNNPSGKRSGLVSGPVTLLSVGDGDTVRVIDMSGTKVTIRLACIDAPESRQNYGRQSTDRLKSLLSSGQLSIKPQTKDRYGRTVAELFIDSDNINLRMVEEGSAWAYRRYLKACNSNAYINAEESAQQKGRGLWSAGKPIAPWDYRRGKRE